MEKLIKVWIVLFDGEGEGPAGDGTFTRRFKRKAEAEAFAVGKTTWGQVATVQEHEVPRKLAQRWGLV